MTYAFLCGYCNNPFEAKQKNTIYCSQYCRWKSYADRRTEEQKTKRKAAMRRWNTKKYQYRRAYQLNYTYGISTEQYDEILKDQHFKCYICQRPETDFAKKLAVDHDHKTGEIFGLLCHICNKIIVGQCRDPDVFKRAAQYLEEGGYGWIVPSKENRKRRRRKKKH